MGSKLHVKCMIPFVEDGWMADGSALARLQRPGILNGIHTLCEGYCHNQMLDEAMHLQSTNE